MGKAAQLLLVMQPTYFPREPSYSPLLDEEITVVFRPDNHRVLRVLVPPDSTIRDVQRALGDLRESEHVPPIHLHDEEPAKRGSHLLQWNAREKVYTLVAPAHVSARKKKDVCPGCAQKTFIGDCVNQNCTRY